MAQLIFLGTAAALPEQHRTNTSLAVVDEAATRGLLIDCGGDVYGALCRSGLVPDVIDDVLITHAHIDHIGSLPSLLESFRLGGRTRALRILAIPEVLSVAQRLVSVFDFEITLDNWTFPVTFQPVTPGEQMELAGIPVTCYRMDHTVPSVGVRMELTQGTIAYTSDTQPNPTLRQLAQGARLLITECTFLKSGEPHARSSRHMTTVDAGRAASEAQAHTLVLVHQGPWSADLARAEIREVFAGDVVIPADGDRIVV